MGVHLEEGVLHGEDVAGLDFVVQGYFALGSVGIAVGDYQDLFFVGAFGEAAGEGDGFA